jgi:tellurite resistance protein
LRGVPKLVRVAAAQSVATGELDSDWQRFALAAFRDNNRLYPVLDLRCLFDKSPADLLSLH